MEKLNEVYIQDNIHVKKRRDNNFNLEENSEIISKIRDMLVKVYLKYLMEFDKILLIK